MACIRKAPMKSMIFAVRVCFGEIFVPVAHCAKLCVCGRKDVGVKAERDGWISVTRKSDGGAIMNIHYKTLSVKSSVFAYFGSPGGPYWYFVVPFGVRKMTGRGAVLLT